MSDPIIFENPKFKPGNIVELRGRIDDIEEGGFKLKVNNFIQVLVPLSETDYDDLIDSEDTLALRGEDGYYTNPVRVEIEIDKNGDPIFKSISIDQIVDIITNDEVLFEGSVMLSLCGNFVYVKNINTSLEVCLRIPPRGSLRDKLVKIVMDKKFYCYSASHPSLVKVRYKHPQFELTDISIERF
jgi:hypothetical protein